MSRKKKKSQRPFVDTESDEYQRGYPSVYKGHKIDQAVYYQTSAQNLAQWKQLQWNSTYYCILLFAGIIGVSTQRSGVCCWQIGLTILSIFVLFVGVFLVRKGQKLLQDERKIRNKNIYFEAGLYYKCDQQKKKVMSDAIGFCKDWHILALLVITIVIGFAITLLLVWQNGTT
jgi:NADH:ubiquinone oxidoreductase subunit 3 (subunit A)